MACVNKSIFFALLVRVLHTTGGTTECRDAYAICKLQDQIGFQSDAGWLPSAAHIGLCTAHIGLFFGVSGRCRTFWFSI